MRISTTASQAFKARTSIPNIVKRSAEIRIERLSPSKIVIEDTEGKISVKRMSQPDKFTSAVLPQHDDDAVRTFPPLQVTQLPNPHNFSQNKHLTTYSSVEDALHSPACVALPQEEIKQNSGERLQRSRERNRIHARKTRQRKKEQMQVLQSRAEELKEQQIILKQSINEKNTASILVGLFSRGNGSEKRTEDPKIEELLQRPIEQIPDASKLPELPALILPGQHNARKTKSSELADVHQELPDDGIDYKLLGKDRSKCSPAELDQIRRERNRMHAKRTRDRKRLFMDEMADMCKRLEMENVLLQNHLNGLNGVKSSSTTINTQQMTSKPHPSVISPSLPPTPAPVQQPPAIASPEKRHVAEAPSVSKHGVTFDQIKTLLEAAGAFSSSSASAVSASTHDTEGGSISSQEDHSSFKRRRLNGSDDMPPGASRSSQVPKSITTNAPHVG